MRADSNAYGTEKISRLLLKVAPPVMLAQLIQALYNLVDSLFVGEYSAEGLTVLSIIYPIQLLMIAFAVGTGVGVNTSMAYYLGINKKDKADEIGGIATLLALFLWIIFAVVCCRSRVIFGKLMDKDFAGNRLCSQKFASYNRKNSRFICAAWLYMCKVWAEFFLVHISGN